MNATDAPQTTQNSSANPRAALAAWLARADFASNALAGVPVDFWADTLGTDPAKWAAEAIEIRIAFEKKMAGLGVGINLPTAPQAVNLGSSGDGLSEPLAEFYRKLWDVEYMKARGGISPAVNRLRSPGAGPYGVNAAR